jgi:hypothetical protein
MIFFVFNGWFFLSSMSVCVCVCVFWYSTGVFFWYSMVWIITGDIMQYAIGVSNKIYMWGIFFSFSLVSLSIQKIFAHWWSLWLWQSWDSVRLAKFRVWIPIPWGNSLILDLGFARILHDGGDLLNLTMPWLSDLEWQPTWEDGWNRNSFISIAHVYLLLFTNKRAIYLDYSDFFFVIMLTVVGTGGIVWVMNMEKRRTFALHSSLMGIEWCEWN